MDDKSPLELLGYAICLNDEGKPVFVSAGYKITLHDVITICLKTSFGHRQPEPLFLADNFSRYEIKKKMN